MPYRLHTPRGAGVWSGSISSGEVTLLYAPLQQGVKLAVQSLQSGEEILRSLPRLPFISDLHPA